MRRGNDLVSGLIMGAGLMYFADPGRGRRRRSVVRDQVVHAGHKLREGAGTTSRDLANRTRGVAAEAGSHLRSGAAEDPVVEARVRTELGRLVSHPGAIDVAVREAQVTLSGPVLSAEAKDLLHGVAEVRGVEGVDNQLQIVEEPGDIPALQGESRKPQNRPELLQENWAPATRLLIGAVGAALALRGLRAHQPVEVIGGLLGLGLVARAASNLTFRRLVGVDAGTRAVDIHRIVNVHAPRTEVFAFWASYENFPRFMSHLREVRMLGSGRSHWVAEAGPVSISWEAQTTKFVPNEVIAWHSVSGSPVQHAGLVRFDENPDGSTRVDIRLSYNPPGGAVGHGLARMFGADAVHLIQDDLVRFKSLLEVGKTSAHGHSITREDVASSL